MKIGIFTFPLKSNYGGILQAYALQEYLKREGHDVWLIKHKKGKNKFLVPALVVKRFIEKFLLNKSVEILFEYNESRINKHIISFVDKYIQPQTEDVYSMGFDVINNSNFDAVVVGSDQVWRPRYIKSCGEKLEDYFLKSVKNEGIKKIGYAVSFGVSNWEYTLAETTLSKSLVKEFKAVSVREDSGISLCKENLDVLPTHVIDPTMLLTPKDYNRLLEKKKYTDNPIELFTYVLDSTTDKKEVISRVASCLGFTPYSVYNPNYKDAKISLSKRIVSPIESWIEGFKNAKFVVTDSFHGCVFAILYNVPFIVYGNRDRGLARFTSLLKMFHLEDRVITDLDQFTDGIISKDIDWLKVNSILEEKRKEARLFLSNSLK